MRNRAAAILLSVALLAGSVLGAQGVTLIPGTTAHRLITAGMDSGPTNVMIRDDGLEFDLGDGRPRFGRLLTLFNAPARRYWWAVYPEGFSPGGLPQGDGFGHDRVAFVRADRLIVFIASYGHIRLSESVGEANTLEEAEGKALRAVEARPGEAFAGAANAWKTIPLDLPSTFYFDPPMSQQSRPTKLLSVVHDGDKWRLTLQCVWKEEVVLDADYQVVKTKRIAP